MADTNSVDTSEAAEMETLDISRIMELIPHRYPFLLIDRLVEVVPGKSAVGIKNVTINENFFQGHFPGAPVMPGVLIVEAMAQTAGALVVHTMGKEAEGKLVYFMTIDKCRFRQPIGPGDQIRIHATALKARGNIWKFKGEAKVDGKLCAQAEYSAMIVQG